MGKENLLDYLQKSCDVLYISDLSLSPLCKDILRRTQADSFPLSQWAEAAKYLTKEKQLSFPTAEAARDFMVNFKTKKEHPGR